MPMPLIVKWMRFIGPFFINYRYHIYCVGLRKVPTGRWHCKVCAACYSCGTKRPSDDDRLAEWHHEVKSEPYDRCNLHRMPD